VSITLISPDAAGAVMPGALTVHVAKPKAAPVLDHVPRKKLLLAVSPISVLVAVRVDRST
jgi:hypothetical protein